MLVYLKGDQVSDNAAEPTYAWRSPASMQAFADQSHAQLQLPFLLLAGPAPSARRATTASAGASLKRGWWLPRST